MSETLMEKKSKKILVVNGILHGHFTGSVEIVRELASMGHDVTCYVMDEFAARLDDVPVKKVVYSADVSEIAKRLPPTAPPFAINSFMFGKAIDVLITLLLKDKTDYDYYVFDSFFDIEEMNKVLNIDPSKFVKICTSFILTDENLLDIMKGRLMGLQETNKKYNINLHDFVGLHVTPNKFKKLILTSKFFHLRPEDTDDTCYFIGPHIEKRVVDNSFDFKKDENKKLLYISLGTVFGKDLAFYHHCIEAFKDSEEYQVIVSVGKFVNIKQYFTEIPKNFSIYNYVPQTQLLPEVDVFITHAGFNSTSEGLANGVPMVLVPQKYDQFDVSRTVKRLNAGIFLNKNEIEITPDVLRNAVKEAYDNRENFKKGINEIMDSFKEARNNRKAIYEKVFE
ncbi:nucleotide disphospho-sugar-binding domain-containing protein [Ruminococcus flavefaciens]|uniref:nucleotide disphospho-sugar-binding domain-containing protein n=1 Tax=Ruminococcus flavefaciens TaxID=1265 RepID=UPI00048DABE0|nr:nucleotide disphospho-sugar-binding domain-containing protein [Ruminococcus flavefaciens]